VLVLSKALGGIGYPLSCIAYDPELDSWEPGAHIGTFRGHQVAMAAGLAALEFTEETNLAEHTLELGKLALGVLRSASREIPAIGDVRGRGLMLGVELVRDRQTKEPWPELATAIRRACCEKGLLVEVGGHFDNVVRFLPPLVITSGLLVRGLEIFVETTRELSERQPAGASGLLRPGLQADERVVPGQSPQLLRDVRGERRERLNEQV
jgi:diaminobutyrate-2-oxoglutarate transaminase